MRSPDVANRCDACHHYGPDAEVAPTVVYGHTVSACRDPRACRKRAQAAGIWKRYP